MKSSIVFFFVIVLITSSVYSAPTDNSILSEIEKEVTVEDALIDNKPTKKITFKKLNKDYDLKEESIKKDKKPKELLNVKKTKYYGDVNIKLMHYVNVTTQNSYSCNCIDTITTTPNGTEQTATTCDTCYKDVTNEVFQEINPETFVLRNNEPIYEVFGNSIQFEEMPDGWGYAVWTDVNILGVEIEGATWWNETFGKKKEIQINNTDLEVSNYSLLLNVSQTIISGCTDFSCIRFANGSENEALSYWIENKVDSLYADVWVKIPYTLTNTTNTTIYMYYDNTSVVSSESDVTKAFLIGDDFSGTDNWANLGGATHSISSGQMSVADSGSDGIVYYDLSVDRNKGYIFEYKLVSRATVFSSTIINNDGSNIVSGYLMDFYANNGVVYYKPNPGWTEIEVDTYTDVSTPCIIKIKHYGANNIKFLIDDNEKGSLSDSSSNSGRIGFRQVASRNKVVDDVIVKRYLSTTPTYSFGAEETQQLDIDFVDPTPVDNNVTSNDYAYVNVSLTSSFDTTSFIDWNNSLVGWWRFNNATDFIDHSSNSNDGTNNGSTYTASGKFGGARDFNGISGDIDCGNDSSLDFEYDDFGVELWVNLNYMTVGTNLVGRNTIVNWEGYAFYTRTDGTVSFAIDNTTHSIPVTSSARVDDNIWHHLVGTRKSNIITLYVDSIAVDTTTSTINISAGITKFVIGNYNHDSGYSDPTNGTIDEVRIWNRALSTEEINASYNTGLYNLYHNFTDLADGNYTYTAYAQDLAGNVNNTETRTITILSDSCAAPTSGNWTLDINNKCSYNSETINIDYLTFENSGDITFTDSTLQIKGLTSGLPSDSRIILFNSSYKTVT